MREETEYVYDYNLEKELLEEGRNVYDESYDLFDYVRVIHDTDSAILLDTLDFGEQWFPKSAIKYIDTVSQQIQIEDWFLDKKGWLDPINE